MLVDAASYCRDEESESITIDIIKFLSFLAALGSTLYS